MPFVVYSIFTECRHNEKVLYAGPYVANSHSLYSEKFHKLPGSSVGIATDYGLDGAGSNPGGGEIFRTCPYWPCGPPSLLYNVYPFFPGVKNGRGVTLTPHLLLVPWSRKSRVYL